MLTRSGLQEDMGSFIPDEDVIETLPDGRQVQLGVKGMPMPMRDALRMGLVEGSAPSPLPPPPIAPVTSRKDKPMPPEGMDF